MEGLLMMIIMPLHLLSMQTLQPALVFISPRSHKLRSSPTGRCHPSHTLLCSILICLPWISYSPYPAEGMSYTQTKDDTQNKRIKLQLHDLQAHEQFHQWFHLSFCITHCYSPLSTLTVSYMLTKNLQGIRPSEIVSLWNITAKKNSTVSRKNRQPCKTESQSWIITHKKQSYSTIC